MIELIIYLLKVLAVHGVLYFFYWLFLKNTLRHQANRFFLLSSLCLAFIIPLIELPEVNEMPLIQQNDLVITWLSNPVIDYEVVMSPIVNNQTSSSYWFLLPLIYLLLTVCLIVRFIFSLTAIRKIKITSITVKKCWFNLFKTLHSRPFSFFSNVFIPESLFDSDDFDQVLAHECVHVKQRHSVDRLLLDFVVSLFWFNPFIYLYRNALIEIHEYQADETVVKRFKDPIRYQEILFSQLQSPQYSGMVSHFNVSTIKKRIVMMNKQKKKSGWIYFIVAPLTLAMIFAFSSKSTIRPIEMIGSEMAGVLAPDDFKFPKINFYQTDYKPSILPLKNSDKVRMTSGYGMRTHPIYKVKKMHLGTDFSCPIGTEIIATADGIVGEIKTTFDGYGKRITINHGDEYQTKYAQLSEFNVKIGDRVTKGEIIGFSGNSGSSTAPHLHYEIIDLATGGRVDPKPFVKNYEFQAVIKKMPAQGGSDMVEDVKGEEIRMLAEKELVESERRRTKAEQQRMTDEKLRKESEEKRVIREQLKEQIESQEEKERDFNNDRVTYQPLIVLDGKVKKDSNFQEIEPSEIHSVKVLKDKKAYIKYGKAGENGVVEIVSKSKKKHKQKDKKKEKTKAFKVIIDPGHGGKDSGDSYANHLNEKDFVLAIAEKVKNEFSDQKEIEVVLTRAEDRFVSLQERKSKATDSDLFISLHSQDYHDSFGGSIVLMHSNANMYYDRSRQVAMVLHDEFNELNEGDCSLASFSSDGEGIGEYWLMNNLEVPAVLVQFALKENKELNLDETEVVNRIARGIRIAAF